MTNIILVLGNKSKKVTEERVDRALEYYSNCGTEKFLMFSGGVSDPTEAEFMKNYAMTKGIDQKNIITEDKSRNTIENFEMSKAILDNMFSHGSCSVVVCTSTFHIKRSMVLARIILTGYCTEFIHTREPLTELQIRNEDNAILCCLRDLALGIIPDWNPYSI